MIKGLCDAKTLIQRALFDGLRPPPTMTVWEWSDKYRILPRSSAEPGRWRTDRTPYLREIMECLSPSSPVNKVVFMKGAQIGGTEIGYNWIGYTIDYDPCAMMIVQPRSDDAKTNSKTRIQPMIDDSPRLKNKIKEARKRDSGNTVMLKEFDGGLLALTGANSAVGLRNKPIKKLMLDEVDGYPGDVDGEGDPAKLAEIRTTTFGKRRKIYYVSTPTLTGFSRIETEYENSDRRKHFLPCPFCGFEQVLIWSQLKWPRGEPRNAKYECIDCKKSIDESYKTQMLERGRWIAERPGAEGGEVAGFHLSALYSPVGWLSWGDIAKDWDEAQRDLETSKATEKLKTFINTRLGETWRMEGEAPSWQRLYHMREKYKDGTVPCGAVILTMGVDVQKDRIEYEVVGWGRGLESWSVDYGVIEGDTATDAPWAGLDELLSRTYPREQGGELPITFTCVDSGYNTQHVYSWVRRHSSRQVVAIKGQDTIAVPVGQPSSLDVKINGKKIRRGVRVWPIGSSVLKAEIYSFLRLEKPTDPKMPYPRGYCHFPERSEGYFEMLTAEELVEKRTKRGFKKFEWRKIRVRNEALDCRVYARAAASIIGLDRYQDRNWEALGAGPAKVIKPANPEPEAKPNEAPKPAPPPKITRRKSSFL